MNKIQAFNISNSPPNTTVKFNLPPIEITESSEATVKPLTNPRREVIVEIKRLIKETLYNSAAQAIIKIIETPHWCLKFFLFICILISTSLCAYLILQLILSYLSFGVSTTTRTIYETKAVRFPKITVCNINPFTTKYAAEFLKKINQKHFAQIDLFNSEQMNNNFNFSQKSKLLVKFYWLAVFEMNNLNETEKRKLSHTLDDIMSSCTFNTQPCVVNDFSWYFDPWYGNCWMFNAAKSSNFSNKVSGEFYGLQMIFYVNFNENLTMLNSYNSGGRGGLIRIENSSYLTSYIPMDGIKIESGRVTSIAVSRSFKSSLPKPYSNCPVKN